MEILPIRKKDDDWVCNNVEKGAQFVDSLKYSQTKCAT